MSKQRYLWAWHMRQARDLLLAERGGDHEAALRAIARWLSNERAGNARSGRKRPLSRKRLRAELRRQVFERDGYRCRHCGSCARLTIHHHIALSRGGTHDPANLLTLCLACHDLEEMRRELLALLRARCTSLVTLKQGPPPGPPVHGRAGFRWRVRRAEERAGAAD